MKEIALILGLILTVSTISSQEILNLEASATDEHMIITYDLKGDADELYNVKLHFLKEDDTKLIPRSLNGDVGKVSAGSGKTIVWDVYKDVNGIDGTLTPVVSAATIIKEPTPDVRPTPSPPIPSKIMDVLTDQIGIGGGKEKKPVRFGIRMGVGNSSVVTEQREFFFTKQRSYLVGPYVRFNISKRFYIQPEILFQQSHYNELLSPEEKIIHKHNYGRAQIMAGVAGIPGLFINGGLYYGQLLSGQEYRDLEVVSQTVTSENLTPPGVEELPIKENEFGYLFGASLSVGQGSFVIGWLYSGGFDDLITGDYALGSQQITGQNLRNRSSHFFIQKAF